MQEKDNTNKPKRSKAGRKPLANPVVHRYDIRLNSTDNCKFENMFDLSSYKYRGHFIRDKVLNSSLKVIETDKTLIDFIIKLSQLRSQFGRVATNYKQLSELLKEQLGEKKALAYLYRLEKATIKMVSQYKIIGEKIQILEKEWLQK